MVACPESPTKHARMYEASLYIPQKEVASIFACHRSTVRRAVQRRLQTGHNAPKRSSGRPPKLNDQLKRRIKRILVQHRRLSLPKILPHVKASVIDIGKTTLAKAVDELGFSRCIARTKPILDTQKRRQRREWVKRQKGQNWRKVIFTDEVAMRMDYSTRTWIWRKEGEEYAEDCMVPKLRQGGKSIMLWGAIWHGGRSELVLFDQAKSGGKRGGVTGQIYLEQITREHLKRCWNKVKTRWRGYGHPYILEDNAPVHTKKETRAEAIAMGFKFINHPPSSPDLNAIENVWAILKQHISQLPRHPTSVGELYEAAKKIWDEMDQSIMDKCIDSMEKRRKAVGKAHGFSTKY